MKENDPSYVCFEQVGQTICSRDAYDPCTDNLIPPDWNNIPLNRKLVLILFEQKKLLYCNFEKVGMWKLQRKMVTKEIPYSQE